MPPGVHGRGDVPELERQASLFFSPTPMIKSKIRRSEQLCRSSSRIDILPVGSERLHLRRFLVTYSDPRHHFPPTPSTHPKAAPCGRTSRRCTTSIRTSQLLDRAENGRLPCDHEKKAALHSRRLALTVFRRLPCQDESHGTRQDIVTAPRG